MMLTGDAEAVEAVKQARRRVGFDATSSPVPKGPGWRIPGWRGALEAVERDLAAKLAAAARPSSSGGERVPVHQPGVEGGDLRKSVERDLAAAHRQGAKVGDALVAAAKQRRAVATAPGAVADAERARDRLREVAKATPEYRDDARLAEASQLADSLATPPTRVPYLPPDPPVAQPWQPHGGDQMASANADALAGGSRQQSWRPRYGTMRRALRGTSTASTTALSRMPSSPRGVSRSSARRPRG